jgi:hypothetical protein
MIILKENQLTEGAGSANQVQKEVIASIFSGFTKIPE